MEDLIPFLIFIGIAVVNVVKYVRENKAKNKPSSPTEQPERAAPASTLESFFEKLAEKLEPQPTPVPDWPKGYEQPDYLGEQKTYEAMQEEQVQPKPVIEPVIEPVSAPPAKVHSASLKSTMSAMPALSSNFSSLRMQSSQMKSGTAGSINYSLRNRAELRKAIIANIIFSTPRACEPSFDNTVSK